MILRPLLRPCSGTRLRQCLIRSRGHLWTSPVSRQGLTPSSLKCKPDCIDHLLRNPELSEEDACDEFRWIFQSVQESANPTSSVSSTSNLVKKQVDLETTITGLCKRRGRGEPLQYILGNTEFGPLNLISRRPVFIPRPETAYVTERLARLINDHLGSRQIRILDVCSGSGSLALLLAHFIPSATVTGIDVCPQALALARENASNLGMEDRVNFVKGDIFSSHAIGEYELIVSNPPYIPKKEWKSLPSSVKDFENPIALIGDPEDLPAHPDSGSSEQEAVGEGKGLTFYRHIAAILPELLASERHSELPILAVEIGADQASDVQGIFTTLSSRLVAKTEVWKDQYGRDRMVICR